MSDTSHLAHLQSAPPHSTTTSGDDDGSNNLPIDLSFVIPVYNEAQSLQPLFEQLQSVLSNLELVAEVIFIDDGSNDASWKVITQLIDDVPGTTLQVVGLRFRRNFGKAAALQAGFAQVRGQRVFTLDADLQDDPQEIPKFLEKMDEGYDLVSGWKKIRHDPWHKTFPSRVFNRMVSSLTGVWLHDHNCGFKSYAREVLQEIQLYGEFHRFTPVLADARGFRVGEVIVQHRARQFGKSKYGWKRIIKGFIDLMTVKFLTDFRNRPQHLLGSAGLILCGLGVAGLLVLILPVLVAGQANVLLSLTIGQALLAGGSALLFLIGIQFLSIGLLAELVTARNQQSHHIYSVAEHLQSHQDSPTEFSETPS